jgi:hypothetical protein
MKRLAAVPQMNPDIDERTAVAINPPKRAATVALDVPGGNCLPLPSD